MKDKLKKIKPVKFDWNKGNLEKSWQKHKVDYKECEQVFFNKPLIISFDQKHSGVEKRFQALGQTNKKRKLFITFTIRGKKIRIISARDISRKERRVYDQKKT